MKLSKFTCLVFFHFAILLFLPGKIDCSPYYHNEGYTTLINTEHLLSDSLCSGALGPNLLDIGDFGSDTAQIVLDDPYITLGYDYQNEPPPDDGTYTITNDISNWGSFAELFWINIQDNSPDPNGYMMVINAHFEPGNFYKDIVAVCENTTYIFGADLINLIKPEVPNFILPSVDFIINGQVVSSVNDIPQDESWHTTEFSYTTGPGETSMTYFIRNSAPGGFGNDLALDNIFMKTCNAQVFITKNGTLCDDGYLEATPFNVPDDFTPHLQWQYTLDGGENWIILNQTSTTLSLNNLPADATYRCLVAAGPNSFGLSSCYGTSNTIDILFPTIIAETNPVICDHDSYEINGNIYTTAGIYQDTFLSFFGCDSIVVTELEVLSSSTYNESVSICEGEVYDFQGADVSVTDQYIDTLINAVGCDSIVTIDLLVLENPFYDFEETICDTDSYFFNDQTISIPGIYLDTLTAMNGCDSFITLQLHVNLSYEILIEETICFGESYNFNGVEQLNSGEYDVTLSSINGCDSTLHLSLNVLDKKEHKITRVICGGQNYTYNNITYASTGIYEHTLIGEAGCDSLVTLNLIFETTIEISIMEQICDTEQFFFNNQFLEEPGIYKDTLLNVDGCDSIVTLTLLQNESTSTNLQQEICEGEEYQFGNEILTVSGSYTDTLINQNGCDSILYLELVVYPIFETDLPVNICFGETYSFNGVDYSIADTYSISMSTVHNCDSIVYLELTIDEEITTNLQEEICEGDSFEMGGTSYTTTGNYETVLPSHTGCDSTVSLNLLVHQNITTSLQETICYGETYQVGNDSFSESGAYTTSLATQYGCDSVVNLSLIVYQSESYEMLTFCNGENYNGFNTDTLLTIIEPSYLGCDSIIQLQLYFREMNALVITGDNQFCEGENHILSVNNFNTYLWSTGETTADIEITESGIYEVTVWDNSGCSSTSSIEVEKRSLDAEISFQNPNCNNSNSGMIQIEDVFGFGGPYLYSMNGAEFSGQTTYFNLSEGIYEVTVRDDKGCDFVEEVMLENPSGFEIELGENQLIEYGDSTEILAKGLDEVRIDTLYWFPEEGLSCLDCLTPMANPLHSTIYTLTVITSDGCVLEDQLHINVFKRKDVFAPNIFSPNGDDQNDEFKIYAGTMVDRILQFEIYDRWGEHVYSETPNSLEMEGWDGTFKNERVKEGVYIFYARVSFIDGDETIIAGDVTVVR